MYHSAVGRGTGISIRATTGGKDGLVVLGYHSRSWICARCRTKVLRGGWMGLQLKTTVGVVLCYPTQGGSNQILLQILQILQTLNQDLSHLVHKWHTRRLQTNSTVFLLKIAVQAETFDHCNKWKELKWFEVIVCDQCHKIKISNQWKIFQLKTTFKSCG